MKTRQSIASAVVLAVSTWAAVAQDAPRPDRPPGPPPAEGTPREGDARRPEGDRPRREDGNRGPQPGERRDARPEGQPVRPMAGIFQLFDANKDGGIDGTEYSDAFKKLDKNADGKITPDEFRPQGAEGQRPPQRDGEGQRGNGPRDGDARRGPREGDGQRPPGRPDGDAQQRGGPRGPQDGGPKGPPPGERREEANRRGGPQAPEGLKGHQRPQGPQFAQRGPSHGGQPQNFGRGPEGAPRFAAPSYSRRDNRQGQNFGDFRPQQRPPMGPPPGGDRMQRPPMPPMHGGFQAPQLQGPPHFQGPRPEMRQHHRRPQDQNQQSSPQPGGPSPSRDQRQGPPPPTHIEEDLLDQVI